MEKEEDDMEKVFISWLLTSLTMNIIGRRANYEETKISGWSQGKIIQEKITRKWFILGLCLHGTSHFDSSTDNRRKNQSGWGDWGEFLSGKQ